ncbi:MAG: tRNA-dihydrouridine synthase family protein, partial [Muribaculaceae bacterium]|nr:tRNA-dihydrouridine synthase family protein [Muribaculaceae bacterium]
MKIYAAPLQGLTDAPWRRFHADVCGGVDTYFMPFLRVEKGIVRAKELRDLASELNRGLDVVPQAIFRSVDELALIADAVRT